MNVRPRRVENRVGEELSKFFTQYGLSPIERKRISGTICLTAARYWSYTDMGRIIGTPSF